ncbi:phosphoribosylformylglycinamidine synthase subunit PurS [Brevibacterium salitolerans]|uniref:Phosphoribosylformylglycinamidine synthase subunit PurS n=1 Tax=Brevibacterium salitolerans TaxID=1403566 RepID=A0ABN2WTG7_9MICO
MGRIVVEVMPKPEILDPQGKAIRSGLERMGLNAFADVRQGKLFHLDVEGPVTEEALTAAREAAGTLLSNPVIEDVVAVRETTAEEAAQ